MCYEPTVTDVFQMTRCEQQNTHIRKQNEYVPLFRSGVASKQRNATHAQRSNFFDVRFEN
jgi:hypothetical protein